MDREIVEWARLVWKWLEPQLPPRPPAPKGGRQWGSDRTTAAKTSDFRTALVRGTLAQTRHFYYTADWRVIEERLDATTTPERQYVWGLRYIDDLVLRDRDKQASTPTDEGGESASAVALQSGTLDERLYALQDGNWNVTAVCDTSGTVQERYAYSAYGEPVFLAPTFATRSGSLFAFETLYAGYRYDTLTGLFAVRNRIYHPALGSWLSRDPAEADRANLLRYVANRPVDSGDPSGLRDPQSSASADYYRLLVLMGSADPLTQFYYEQEIRRLSERANRCRSLEERCFGSLPACSPSRVVLLKYPRVATCFSPPIREGVEYSISREHVPPPARLENSPWKAALLGGLAGLAEVGRVASYPARWVGIDFSRQDRALEETWRRTGLYETTTYRFTRATAKIAVGSAYAAGGVSVWQQAGLPTWGVAWTKGRGGHHVLWSVTRGGQTIWYHATGIPGFLYTDTASQAALAGAWTFEGVPILFGASAASTPAGYNCATTAVHSFWRGWFLWR